MVKGQAGRDSGTFARWTCPCHRRAWLVLLCGMDELEEIGLIFADFFRPVCFVCVLRLS